MTNSDPLLHRDCPLCGASASRAEMRSAPPAETRSFAALRPFWAGLFREKVFFSYHRCADCGLLYNPVYFHEHQLAALYADMAPNMDLVSDGAIAATQAGYFRRAMAEGAPAGGYLEIGPDVGHIAGHAARSGRFDRFWLFEPNLAVHDTLRAVARGKPATVLADMTDLSPVPDRSVGMAVMVHVLDHLLDPVAMLRQILAKLRPGGTLMIVTHDERSWLRKVTGVRWPPFCLQHPELYNPATMRKLLAHAGYRDVIVERSRNVFPLDFLAKQAAWAVGLRVTRMPLPSLPIGVRLGNILTLAKAPATQAATEESEVRAPETAL